MSVDGDPRIILPPNTPKARRVGEEHEDPYFAEDYDESSPYTYEGEREAAFDSEGRPRIWLPPQNQNFREREIEAMLASWVDSPFQFAMDAFGQKPREWQPEVMARVAASRRTAIKACRKAGKTAMASYLAWWWMVTRPYSLVYTTAPTHRQVKDVLWVEIKKLWMSSILPKLFPGWYVTQTSIVTGHPEWRAFGVSSDRPERFEGPHGRSVLVIYDEAKAVKKEVYEIFQGMLADGDWKEIAISTPGAASGWFWECFTKNRDHWTTCTISSADIPRLRPKHDEEKLLRGASDTTFRRQQLAEFAGAETGALIGLGDLEACIGLGFTKEGRWPKVMGVDPAGAGRDEFAVAIRYGPVVRRIITWSGRDEMWSVGNLIKLIKEYRPEQVLIDSPGLGHPLISRLREQGYDVDAFNPSARALNNEDYENLKTEVAFGLRTRFMERQIALPNDEKLVGQFATYTTDQSSRGRTKLVDPDASPDRADAVIAAFSPDFVQRVGLYSYTPPGGL